MSEYPSAECKSVNIHPCDSRVLSGREGLLSCVMLDIFHPFRLYSFYYAIILPLIQLILLSLLTRCHLLILCIRMLVEYVFILTLAISILLQI
jgi:hypothetical protein